MSAAKHLVIGIQGHALTSEEVLLIQHYQPAGVILFGRNIKSVEQLTELIAQLKSLTGNQLFISLDLEGGRVNRLRDLGLELPSASQLAQAGNELWIKEQARLIAQAMEFFSFNLNYAPVLDIDEGLQVQNALGHRCWGKSPEEVITNLTIWIASFKKHSSALLVGKHFPGSGYAQSDPHEDLPVIKRSMAELQAHELKPFIELASQLEALMSSHLLYQGLSEHPASLSAKNTQLGQLKELLNFKGLWVTDDLDMGAVTQGYGQKQAVTMAIEAGFNLCLVCHETKNLPALIDSLPNKQSKPYDVPSGEKPHDLDWENIVDESRKLTQQVQVCLKSQGLDESPELPSSAVEEY